MILTECPAIMANAFQRVCRVGRLTTPAFRPRGDIQHAFIQRVAAISTSADILKAQFQTILKRKLWKEVIIFA